MDGWLDGRMDGSTAQTVKALGRAPATSEDTIRRLVLTRGREGGLWCDCVCLPNRVPLCSGSSITEIINPSYMGVGPFAHVKQALSPDQQPSAWSYDQPSFKDPSLGPGRGESPPTPPSQPPISPKKFSSATASRSPCSRTQESR